MVLDTEDSEQRFLFHMPCPADLITLDPIMSAGRPHEHCCAVAVGDLDGDAEADTVTNLLPRRVSYTSGKLQVLSVLPVSGRDMHRLRESKSILGLAGMSERASRIRGRLIICTSPGGGTLLELVGLAA